MSKLSLKILAQAYKDAAMVYKRTNLNSFCKISKIVVHIGIGKVRDNKQLIENLFSDLYKITGQKPNYTIAKKSVSSFKLRKGEKVGLQVTLRNEKMADFIYKVINITLPAIRDFKGMSRDSFDKQGNYSFGIRELIVFPELSFSELN